MKKVLAWVLFLHLIYFPPSLPSYFYCSRKYLKGLRGFSYSMSKKKKKMLCLKPFKILGRSQRIKQEKLKKLPQTPSRSSPELQRHHQGRLQLLPPGDNGSGSGGGGDKRANHHILIADRLQATAAGNAAAIQWRLLLQQMDQRCAVRSKSGTLNNSATSPVTLTAV